MLGLTSPLTARLGATRTARPLRWTFQGRKLSVTPVRQRRTIHQQRWTPVRAVAVPNKRNQQSKAEHDTPPPFLDPFLRSFLLGLGAACVFEAGHVTSQFVTVVGEVADEQKLAQLAEFISSAREQFAPLVGADHVAAIAFWVLFYVIEAGAVAAVLQRHPHDNAGAALALSKLTTPLKRLMPMRLSLIKTLLKGRLQSRGALKPTTASAFTDGPALQGPMDLDWPIPKMGTPTGRASSNVVPAPRLGKDSQPPKRAEPQGFAEGPGVMVPGRGVAPEVVPGLEKNRWREGKRLVPGEVEIGDSQWAHRQKELLNRRLYLKDFWYAAALSQDVTDKPHGVEILGQKMVLYRESSGKVVAVSDVCPHRGAPLHMGWTAEVAGHDCVVCPYHGWAFDQDGIIRDVPAAVSEGDWPKKAVLKSYDLVEKGGFVWMFNGNKAMPMNARPPIPFVPELEDPIWKPVYGEIEFECGHWAVFENAIDMAHIHYLHSDSFGNKEQPEIREMKAENDAYSVSATFSLHNKPMNALWNWTAVPQVQITAKAMLPSTSVIQFTLGNGLSFSTFVSTVPINSHRTVNRFALVRNLSGPVVNKVFNIDAWDKLAHDAMIKILSEDKVMVEQLRPDLLEREVNVKADGVQTAFCKLRQSWLDLGYGALPESSEDHSSSNI